MKKRTIILLNKIICDYPKNYIFYLPTEEKSGFLKNLLKNCSKTGNNSGIPDTIYYDNHDKNVILFECKSNNIKLAENDLEIYYSKIKNSIYHSEIKNLFLIAFSPEKNS